MSVAPVPPPHPLCKYPLPHPRVQTSPLPPPCANLPSPHPLVQTSGSSQWKESMLPSQHRSSLVYIGSPLDLRPGTPLPIQTPSPIRSMSENKLGGYPQQRGCFWFMLDQRASQAGVARTGLSKREGGWVNHRFGPSVSLALLSQVPLLYHEEMN